ncbi:MAG TPA: hypothetical protein VH813_05220 [Candidatus Limnocylindrales bacterium]
MAEPIAPQLLVVAGGGIVAGLALLARGFSGYGTASRIEDTSTSRIGSLAIGEVLVTGAVETAELSLISPLQSAPCVYYRSRIEDSGGDDTRRVLDEERAIGFHVRDATGTVRVFPAGARFDVPARFDESSGTFGATPPGLRLRTGSAIASGRPSREQLIEDLLTVRPASSPNAASGGSGGDRRYLEARIEPGDVVTVVGRVMPFDQLPDPTTADQLDGPATGASVLRDPEIAADLAAARAAGVLAATPEAAWGNAAIPGFGIGRPARDPQLDPRAHALPLSDADEASRVARTFDIPPDGLVLASSGEVPLLIGLGSPDRAADRQERRFLVGLLGAVLAIGSAMALAIMLGGGLGR